jgi:hypothetical protein
MLAILDLKAVFIVAAWGARRRRRRDGPSPLKGNPRLDRLVAGSEGLRGGAAPQARAREAVVMASKDDSVIRICVGTRDGAKSGVWRICAGKDKSDVYVAVRS